jgi:hypothetical protein
MCRPHLRIVPPARSDAAPFVAVAVQAAELAGRFMERGEIAHALDALTVARTLLEHVQRAGPESA